MKLQFLNLKQRYNLKDYKFTLILLVLAVSVIGVFMVGSAAFRSDKIDHDLVFCQIFG